MEMNPTICKFENRKKTRYLEDEFIAKYFANVKRSVFYIKPSLGQYQYVISSEGYSILEMKQEIRKILAFYYR